MIRRRLWEIRGTCSSFPDWNRLWSWSVYKGLHLSQSKLKKRKTESDENETPIHVSKHKQIPVVDVWKDITVGELAKNIGKSPDTILSVLDMMKGTRKYKGAHSILDEWSVTEGIFKRMRLRYRLVSNPNEKTEVVSKNYDAVKRDPSQYIRVLPRPPVVTIMGHVDHGKTTLLDSVRNSNVVQSEFGGITQHIGAFSVLANNKDKITFLDTPGHAAFCAMRSRGAHCTDIVVLVVAADDGVMEQTIESIRMAKEAKVPIIVAINKIDKASADIERTKKMLVQYEVQVEDYGGDIQVVPVSALKGTNLDVLMDAILVQAEMMELKSDYDGLVEGTVIESTTHPHRGKLCTMLVQCGTLKKGAVLVSGTAWCKVRAMFNEKGDIVQEAPPSTPVEVIGWRELPPAGDMVLQVGTEKRAHEVIAFRKSEQMKKKQEEDQIVIKSKMEEHLKEYRSQLEERRRLKIRYRKTGPRQKEDTDSHTGPRLSILIKGDVDGSVEAILDVIDTYNSDLCKLDVVHYGVGPVSQSDVTMAQAFSAIIYTFNTKVLENAQEEASQLKVPIKKHNIIYKLIDSIKDEINKILPEKEVEDIVGEANVLQEFLINEGKSKVPVAGCRCTKGNLKKGDMYKLVRGEETIYNGAVASLRHLKDEVESIKKGLECGVRLSDTEVRFQSGDLLICYQLKKVPQKVTWDPGF